jgi:hypothetical protein
MVIEITATRINFWTGTEIDEILWKTENVISIYSSRAESTAYKMNYHSAVPPV